MRRDLRDPAVIGRILTQRVEAGDGTVLAVADELPRFAIPRTRGDESPLERYGDPRSYDVEVETTIRRVPKTFAEVVYDDSPIGRLAT